MERDIRWRVHTWCFVLVDLIAGMSIDSVLFARPHSSGILSQASFPAQFQPQPYFGTVNQQQQPTDDYYNFMPTAPTLYAQVWRREVDEIVHMLCVFLGFRSTSKQAVRHYTRSALGQGLR